MVTITTNLQILRGTLLELHQITNLFRPSYKSPQSLKLQILRNKFSQYKTWGKSFINNVLRRDESMDFNASIKKDICETISTSKFRLSILLGNRTQNIKVEIAMREFTYFFCATSCVASLYAFRAISNSIQVAT